MLQILDDDGRFRKDLEPALTPDELKKIYGLMVMTRVADGKAVIKKTLPLCLSFDHRVVDGAEAARFTNDLKKFLEDGAALETSLKVED